MANVRIERRLAELESKAAAANGGKLHVLYAPVGLYGAALDGGASSKSRNCRRGQMS